MGLCCCCLDNKQDNDKFYQEKYIQPVISPDRVPYQTYVIRSQYNDYINYP